MTKVISRFEHAIGDEGFGRSFLSARERESAPRQAPNSSGVPRLANRNERLSKSSTTFTQAPSTRFPVGKLNAGEEEVVLSEWNQMRKDAKHQSRGPKVQHVSTSDELILPQS